MNIKKSFKKKVAVISMLGAMATSLNVGAKDNSILQAARSILEIIGAAGIIGKLGWNQDVPKMILKWAEYENGFANGKTRPQNQQNGKTRPQNQQNGKPNGPNGAN